jgi:hypothetical protein
MEEKREGEEWCLEERIERTGYMIDNGVAFAADVISSPAGIG